MKTTMVGVVALMCIATVSMAEQGAGIGGSYQDGLYGPLLKYEWMFAKHFGVECRASYLTGSQDTEVVAKEKHYQGGVLKRRRTATTSGDMDLTAIPLEAALKIVYPVEKWTPYMLLGGGYYIYDGDITTFGGPDASPENALGVFGAVGAEFKVGRTMLLFAEVRYTKATWDSEEDYAGNRREWRGIWSYADYEYTGTQTVEGGLDGVGGSIGMLWNF